MMQESHQAAGNTPPIVYKPVYLGPLLAGLGVVAGFVNVICGIFVALSTSPLCIIDGIFMIFYGLTIITLETPFNCAFFPFMEKVNSFTAQRTPMQRSIIYIVCGLLGFLLCISVASFIGGGVVFACGGLYVWKWYQDRQHAKMYMYTSTTITTQGQVYSDVNQSAPTSNMGSAAASAAGYVITNHPDLVEKAAVGAAQGYMASRTGPPSGPGYYP